MSSIKTMIKFLLLLPILVSCATYTDPEQEKLTYYQCEKNQELLVKHSDDYETIAIRLRDQQILLRHFIQENGDGYRNTNYLWVTKGRKAKLISLKDDGREEVFLGECVTEKQKIPETDTKFRKIPPPPGV